MSAVLMKVFIVNLFADCWNQNALFIFKHTSVFTTKSLQMSPLVFLSIMCFSIFCCCNHFFLQSPVSPAPLLNILSAPGMGGVSRVSHGLLTSCQSKLESMRPQRSHPVHQAHPPGPGGKPRLWKRCSKGRVHLLPCSILSQGICVFKYFFVSIIYNQVFSNGSLTTVLCGKKEYKELQETVNPLLFSSPGGCLTLLFHSDYSNTKRHSGFRGFYTIQGETH